MTVVETVGTHNGADRFGMTVCAIPPTPTTRAVPCHARFPPFVNIWRGRVTTNSVNSSTSLSTVIVPPCC